MAEQVHINLTPSPRVLRMLGQIDFKPWQCLAELIDNSADAFLSARADSAPVLFPQVNIEISSSSEIRHGSGVVQVSDNGPGMAPEQLEKALKAGYSTNNPVDKLGLFGMGFNVATARLGGRTEVWTTRVEDDHWSGVRIDFDELEKAGSFEVPALRRAKTAIEADAHGTEIRISKLDVQRALYLRTGAGLRATRDKLSRVYNKIILDLGLKVLVAGYELEGRQFCVWDRKRTVDTKSEFGRVPAILEIDEDLGEQRYCDDCWVWLLDSDEMCPSCGTTDGLRSRGRKVQGWLGIQRFFDQQDYGIDLIRNGRVIEERSKSFFSWTNSETGETLMEYPVEQTHWGGRIVGELNIDFVPLASHQKDAFDKTAREWSLVEQVVRGDGPIIQVYRQRLGLPDRVPSPMARLHQGYRRGQPPGFRWLVPGDAQGKGINKEPQLWALEFWKGNPEYQDDKKWWEAVEQAEAARTANKGAEVAPALIGAEEFDAPSVEEQELEPDQDAAGETPYHGAEFLDDPVLSRVYELPDFPGAPRLDAVVQRLASGRLERDAFMEWAAVSGQVELKYDPHHPMFREALTEPVDCLVNELSYQLLSRSSATQREWPLSRIAHELRSRYFPWSLDSYSRVYEDSKAILNELVEHYSEKFASSPVAEDQLTETDMAELSAAVARAEKAGAARVREVIQFGLFPRYLGVDYADVLLERWPELAFDGQFFAVGYSDLNPAFRGEVLASVLSAVRDLKWATRPEGMQAGSEEWKNMLGRAAHSDQAAGSLALE